MILLTIGRSAVGPREFPANAPVSADKRRRREDKGIMV
jgi:hypothetical protein